MKVRIAVVQFEIAQLAREKNFERIEKFIQRAARQGAQVIVFPEDCITGSIFGVLSRLDTTQMAQRTFQALATRYKIDIVTGSSMEGTSRGNFNTGYYINAEGHILGMYRKNHLYPSERSFLKAGDDVPVFETAFGKAGIVICWDMLFPEIFQRMKAKGVELIYCPSYWYREIAESMAKHNPRSEEDQIDALCMTRALETNAVLTYCNAAGTAAYENGTKDTLIGHSQIVMPVLGAVRKLRHQRETMFIHEVDVGLLAQSRKIYQA